MKSSLFQFFFLDMRSTGAAEGIDGKKKILKKFYVRTVVAYRCRVLNLTINAFFCSPHIEFFQNFFFSINPFRSSS